jgi:hypothetical protein
MNEINPKPALDLPDIEVLSVSRSIRDGAIAFKVRSMLPQDLTCPFCGKSRWANGTRTVRYRDVPRDGHAVCVAWKRQQYRCGHGCGRGSDETHPAFHERHYATRRLIEWIAQEGRTRTFASLAKEAGMKEELVRDLFHGIVAPQAGSTFDQVDFLAIENIYLAGRYRPALIDVRKPVFLDVFASADKLEQEFGIWQFTDGPILKQIKIVVQDISLESSPNLSSQTLQSLFPNTQEKEEAEKEKKKNMVVSRSSLVREAIKMMADACHSTFEARADADRLSAKFARVLFLKPEHTLGRSARLRLRRWENKASNLHRAFYLKERFVEIWWNYSDDAWNRWAAQAGSLSEIDYGPIIKLVKSRKEEITNYYKYRELAFFDSWLETAISKFKLGHTHSFAAARVAFLTEQNVKASRPKSSSN